MKSILQEATSVEKAVAKAWEAADSPNEFSVKILEPGQRGFLGFSSKDAIISLVYETHSDKTIHKTQNSTRKPTRQSQQRQNPIRSREEKPVDKRTKETPHQKSQENTLVWTDEMSKTVSEILSDILKTINSDAQIKTIVTGNALSVKFSQKILPEEETERSLRASLSYLVLQALKRKLRRKLRGFKLHIDSGVKE